MPGRARGPHTTDAPLPDDLPAPEGVGAGADDTVVRTDPDYTVPTASAVRNVTARMVRVREIAQTIRVDVAGDVLTDEATVESLTVAIVGLANCVEALAEVNS